MTRAAKIYTYPLTAGQTVNLDVDAGYYKLLEATGPVRIGRDGGTGLDGLEPGQGERENFTKLTITDQSNAANNIRLIVADSSFVDDTIYGQVQVVDGGRLIAMTDAAYVGTASATPTAGFYGAVQLWNPPGNTKWAAISRVICSTFGTVVYQLRPSNSALLTAGNVPQPKKILTGTSNSTMQTRFDTPAALPGGSVIGLCFANTGVPFVFELKEPIILQPGQGLIAANGNIAQHMSANFDFYEFTP